MDKYKVGDRVVFNSQALRDMDPKYYPPVGTIGTIVRVDGDGFPKVQWDGKPDPNRVKFPCDAYLDFAPSNNKILIMVDKHDPLKVVARDLDNNKTGEAHCHPGDEFDFFIGAAIALGRLFGHEPEFNFGDKPREPLCAEASKPTFKVGDRVRMKQDCAVADTGWGKDTIRKGVCSVTEVRPNGGTITLEGLPYGYSPDWLDPALCKFKVGDKIIGNANANRYGITKEGWIGEVTVILSEPEEGHGSDKGRTVTFIAKGKEGAPFWLSDDAFDLYEEPEEETVIHCNLEENARLIAMIMDFDAEGKVFDWYEQHIQQLSDWYEQQLRAHSEAELEEPKYYNGKLVCTYSDYGIWTVGKVYPVVDGTIYDNKGAPRFKVESADQLTRRLSDPEGGEVRFVDLEPGEDRVHKSTKLEGKLVCIRSDVGWWTEGRIYEAVNGVLIDDDGDATASYGTLEACNAVTVHRQFAFLKE